MSFDISFIVGTAGVIGIGMWASSWANRRAARGPGQDGSDGFEGDYVRADDDAFEGDGGSFGGGGASGDWGDDGDGGD